MDPNTIYPNPTIQNTPVSPSQDQAGLPVTDPSVPQMPPAIAIPGSQISPPTTGANPLQAPLPGHLQNQTVHLRSNPNSTQNTLEIAEIRDGIVILNDGSFRSVVMVKSINFDLMSTSEQEAIEYVYQRFLNSLVFPIQIFIRSREDRLTPLY